jgi:uncharacterized protein
MKIKIKNIEDGVHLFHFEETAESINLDSPFCDTIKVNCKLDKSQRQFVLTCDLNVPTNFECDRCSKSFKSELSKNFKLFYFFDKTNFDNDDANSFYLSPEEDYIDIKSEVIDYALLSVPMKVLCSEDCKGLCAGCGVDLNTENCKCSKEEVRPEWEELLKLKDKLNK